MAKGKQIIQEEEYRFPYHWQLRKNSRKGVVFYGYYTLALQCAGDLSGKMVLDVGCGDGFFTDMIRQRGAERIVGIDYSRRALSFAQLLAPHGTFLEGEICALPVESESYDTVFLIETFEHLSTEKKACAVRELARVLKPEGRLIVTVPSIRMPIIEKHEEHFTKDSLIKAFSEQFHAEHVLGQDNSGWISRVFWFIWSLWDNRIWRIKPVVNRWMWVSYQMFMSRVPIPVARRFVGVFIKKEKTSGA